MQQCLVGNIIWWASPSLPSLPNHVIKEEEEDAKTTTGDDGIGRREMETSISERERVWHLQMGPKYLLCCVFIQKYSIFYLIFFISFECTKKIRPFFGSKSQKVSPDSKKAFFPLVLYWKKEGQSAPNWNLTHGNIGTEKGLSMKKYEEIKMKRNGIASYATVCEVNERVSNEMDSPPMGGQGLVLGKSQFGFFSSPAERHN